MSEKKRNEKERIEIMMPIENIAGKYSNYQRIGHTPTEFIIDFCMLEGSGNAHSISRIIVNPMQVKSLVQAMQENISRYEKSFNMVLPETTNDFIEKGAIKTIKF